MRLVTRYILREHVGPLIFAVTTLTSLLLLNYISKRFADLVGKGLPWTVIAKFFVLSVPFTLAMTLPMAVLIATLYAFSRLAADSEVTAMMACGVGPRQMLTPVLGAGIVLSLAMLWFNDQLLPHANQELSALTSSIAQKKPTLALKPQTLNVVSKTGMFIWMAQLDRSSNGMRDVTIYDVTAPQMRRTIVAHSGELAFDPNGRDLLLTLHHGFVQETRNALPARMQRMFFRSNIVRVNDVANELVQSGRGEYKGDREMTICELQDAVTGYQHERDSILVRLRTFNPVLANQYQSKYGSNLGVYYCAGVAKFAGPRHPKVRPIRPSPMQASLPPQSGTVDPSVVPAQILVDTLQLTATQKQISMFEVEIHKKFAISLACLIFALLGPPIALRFPRGGVGLTIGVSLTAFSLYYIGLIAGEKLSDHVKVSPTIAMWAANTILGTIGLVLALRMGRRGTNARGGGLGELLDRLFPWRHRGTT